jgi:beta-lactam-binding protein with PASTA domain
VRGFLQFLWTALVLIVVALVSALVTMRLAVHGHEVAVPDVRGKTPAEARYLAEMRGLSTQIERQYYSPTVPEGRVLSQVPEPGAVVRRGWELRLALSLGPQRVTIPQVVGQSERAASIILQQRGLDSSSRAEIALPKTTAGQVLGQDPPANAANVVAPRVNLLVADEGPPQTYVMPSLIGQPLASVTLALEDAGFTLDKLVVKSATGSPASTNPKDSGADVAPATSQAPGGVISAPPPPGNVASTNSPAATVIISQDPAPGQKIAVGSEIRFVVH